MPMKGKMPPKEMPEGMGMTKGPGLKMKRAVRGGPVPVMRGRKAKR